MPTSDPVADLDARFGEPDAPATPWSDVRDALAEAEIFWLSTVRRAGGPHVTPLLAVWQDDRLHFCTGPGEQKARNLEHNRQCILTTGQNAYREGLDVVVEGEAVRVTDTGRLRRFADTWTARYGAEWGFEVRNDTLYNGEGGRVLVFELAPTTAFAFHRGPYSQTRYRFE